MVHHIPPFICLGHRSRSWSTDRYHCDCESVIDTPRKIDNSIRPTKIDNRDRPTIHLFSIYGKNKHISGLRFVVSIFAGII